EEEENSDEAEEAKATRVAQPSARTRRQGRTALGERNVVVEGSEPAEEDSDDDDDDDGDVRKGTPLWKTALASVGRDAVEEMDGGDSEDAGQQEEDEDGSESESDDDDMENNPPSSGRYSRPVRKGQSPAKGKPAPRVPPRRGRRVVHSSDED
ncbi:hypothetical protein HK104_000982, partial [Borealophlyctis nickersoniae]